MSSAARWSWASTSSATAWFYGPLVANRLIAETLYPYPRDLVIAAARRQAPGQELGAGAPSKPGMALREDPIPRLRVERLDVVRALHRTGRRDPLHGVARRPRRDAGRGQDPPSGAQQRERSRADKRSRARPSLPSRTCSACRAAAALIRQAHSRRGRRPRRRRSTLHAKEHRLPAVLPAPSSATASVSKADPLRDRRQAPRIARQIALAWLSRSPVMLPIRAQARSSISRRTGTLAASRSRRARWQPSPVDVDAGPSLFAKASIARVLSSSGRARVSRSAGSTCPVPRANSTARVLMNESAALLLDLGLEGGRSGLRRSSSPRRPLRQARLGEIIVAPRALEESGLVRLTAFAAAGKNRERWRFQNQRVIAARDRLLRPRLRRLRGVAGFLAAFLGGRLLGGGLLSSRGSAFLCRLFRGGLLGRQLAVLLVASFVAFLAVGFAVFFGAQAFLAAGFFVFFFAASTNSVRASGRLQILASIGIDDGSPGGRTWIVWRRRERRRAVRGSTELYPSPSRASGTDIDACDAADVGAAPAPRDVGAADGERPQLTSLARSRS